MSLRIGISCALFYPDNQRPIFKGKTLLYAVEPIAEWVMASGEVPFLLPRPFGQVSAGTLLEELDGLILMGGSDVSPKFYGEEAINEDRHGDEPRDKYELSLLDAAITRKIPVLGVCRGLQLLNVFLGGSLYQDLGIQIPHSDQHRNWDVYEHNLHHVAVEPGSHLANIYPDGGNVSSIHSQAIKDLGKGLVVEARAEDGTIEAVRSTTLPNVSAVQWHPEFHPTAGPTVLDPKPLMDDFLGAVAKCRSRITQ
jgi:putative glutamine amidotransferase